MDDLPESNNWIMLTARLLGLESLPDNQMSPFKLKLENMHSRGKNKQYQARYQGKKPRVKLAA